MIGHPQNLKIKQGLREIKFLRNLVPAKIGSLKVSNCLTNGITSIIYYKYYTFYIYYISLILSKILSDENMKICCKYFYPKKVCPKDLS